MLPIHPQILLWYMAWMSWYTHFSRHCLALRWHCFRHLLVCVLNTTDGSTVTDLQVYTSYTTQRVTRMDCSEFIIQQCTRFALVAWTDWDLRTIIIAHCAHVAGWPDCSFWLGSKEKTCTVANMVLCTCSERKKNCTNTISCFGPKRATIQIL